MPQSLPQQRHLQPTAAEAAQPPHSAGRCSEHSDVGRQRASMPWDPSLDRCSMNHHVIETYEGTRNSYVPLAQDSEAPVPYTFVRAASDLISTAPPRHPCHELHAADGRDRMASRSSRARHPCHKLRPKQASMPGALKPLILASMPSTSQADHISTGATTDQPPERPLRQCTCATHIGHPCNIAQSKQASMPAARGLKSIHAMWFNLLTTSAPVHGPQPLRADPAPGAKDGPAARGSLPETHVPVHPSLPRDDLVLKASPDLCSPGALRACGPLGQLSRWALQRLPRARSRPGAGSGPGAAPEFASLRPPAADAVADARPRERRVQPAIRNGGASRTACAQRVCGLVLPP